MDPLFSDIARLLAAGDQFALGTVVHTAGSTPQKAGARAIFLAGGQLLGTLGGGCMEAEARLRGLQLVAGGEPPFQIGIGLHAGEGVAGHIGAASRHEYSVIGDVTNVAARLEGMTKDVGYPLVCSRVVVDQLPGQAGLVALGSRELKGHSPVEVFAWGVQPLQGGPTGVGRRSQ